MNKKLFTITMEDGDDMEVYHIVASTIEMAIDTAYHRFAELVLESGEQDYSDDDIPVLVTELRQNNVLVEVTADDVIVCSDTKLRLVK